MIHLVLRCLIVLNNIFSGILMFDLIEIMFVSTCQCNPFRSAIVYTLQAYMLSHLSTTASKHDVATDLINHHQIGRGMTIKNEGIIILRMIFQQRSSQITGSSSKHGRAAAAAPQSVYSTVCAVAAIFCSRRAEPISPEDCRRSFEGNGSSPPSADNSKLGRVGP